MAKKTEDVSNLNLYQKLAKIRKQVEVMQKNTKAFNYNYVKEEDILAKVTTFMEKYDLSLIPRVIHGSLNVEPYYYEKTKSDKKGNIYNEKVNEVLVSADMTWTWVNNQNPEERIDVDWTMVGQQADASQAFGSGLTYSSRYFLLKYFNVSTPNDDPDNWRSKQKKAEEDEERMTAEAIIEQVDEAIKEFLAGNENEKENVRAFAKKYVKNGNYFDIKDPALAASFYKDFVDAFMGEEE